MSWTWYGRTEAEYAILEGIDAYRSGGEAAALEIFERLSLPIRPQVGRHINEGSSFGWRFTDSSAKRFVAFVRYSADGWPVGERPIVIKGRCRRQPLA